MIAMNSLKGKTDCYLNVLLVLLGSTSVNS